MHAEKEVEAGKEQTLGEDKAMPKKAKIGQNKAQ
jgi:hypothetical protein